MKRYVVRSVPDAMARIREDLGDQAVILDSKPIRQGGLWGLFGKRRFEVIAAVDVKKETRSTRFHDDRLTREVQSLKKLMLNWMDGQKRELPPNLARLDRLLREQQVSQEVIQSLIQSVASALPNMAQADEREVIEAARREVENAFKRAIQPIKVGQGKKYVYFVGPTGVGKTTTIAKIAARYALDGGRKVGLMTADTYRIAAVEQLRTYANILNVPLEVLHDPQDLPAAKEKLAHCDVILCDTAGRNFRQKMNVSELLAFVEPEEAAAVYLVISLTMREQDVQAILDNFASSPVTHVLLTKRDETTACGLALNLAWQTKYKLDFVTTGQNVPDDIVEANAAELTNWLLGVSDDDRA